MLLEYKIIDGNDKESVYVAVSEHLQSGWVLYGNLCMDTCPVPGTQRVAVRYAQSVTKEYEPQSR